MIIRNLQFHLKAIAASKSPRFVFFRFLHIINRRIRLPKGCFIGQELLGDELILEKYIDVSNPIVFLDIGAKTGLWSKKLADKCLEIHAFEPNPETIALLKKNTRRLKNVIIHQCAVGDKNEIKAFLISRRLENCGFVERLKDYTGTILVPVRTIDSFNFDKVDLIKVDTEGYELPIILGALKTIEDSRPQLYIEIHELEQEAPIKSILKKMGYTYVTHYMERIFRQPIIITNTPKIGGYQ